MKKSEKIVFWSSIVVYTVSYFYFFLASLEISVSQIFRKSVLGSFSGYFDSDWMAAPVVGFGIALFISTGFLTHIIYGRFPRGTALLPCGGILILAFGYWLAIAASVFDIKFLYGLSSVLLLVSLLCTWIFCLREYKKILKTTETD